MGYEERQIGYQILEGLKEIKKLLGAVPPPPLDDAPEPGEVQRVQRKPY